MSFYYILKVWLTSIIVTPALFILLSILTNAGMDNDAIELIFCMIIFGFVLSIPTLGFCYLVAFLLTKKLNTVIKFKIAVILSALFGLWLTLFLMSGEARPSRGEMSFFTLYGSCIIVSGMLYKAKEQPANLN